MRKRIISLILCVILFLTACGKSSDAKEPVREAVKETIREKVPQQTESVAAPATEAVAKETQQIEDKIPVSTVKVLVDRNGYLIGRDKTVNFLGENMGTAFRVVEEASQEIVYTGTIMNKTYLAEQEQYVSQGDFTELEEPGSYYIETDIIGRSYTFEIAEDTYSSVFENLIQAGKNLEYEQSPETVCNIAFSMNALMLALQCHGTLFEKDNDILSQIRSRADLLVSLQDEKNGNLYEDYEATAAFCGIMAMCSHVFEKYDAQVSKEYMAAALKAWDYLEKQEGSSKASFYAAAQLFRAKGGFPYHTIIMQYLSEHKADIAEERFAFYGAVTYLRTELNTNKELCSSIMQTLVDETERICQTAKHNPYLVYDEEISVNLSKVLMICVVDYITPSNEYEILLENTLHYILGRNENGYRYLNGDGSWAKTAKTAEQTAEWDGIILYCLSDLLDKEVD